MTEQSKTPSASTRRLSGTPRDWFRNAGRTSPWLLLALAVIAIVVVVWLSRTLVGHDKKNKAASGSQPVSVQAARKQDIRTVVNAIGSFTANNTAVVRAQVSGVLLALAFKEGQQVKAGQLLAQIDPRQFDNNLGQSQGTLERDQAQLASAKFDLARYQGMFEKDAIAKQQVDTQAALVKQIEGTVSSDESAVHNAKLQQSYAQVTAPISGRVGLKQADIGNVVAPADPNGIVSIAQTRPIALIFSVPAANLPQITAQSDSGKSLPVEVWDSAGTRKLATGQVLTLDNAIDPATDSIKVKALFANDNDALFPNQAVSVRLQTGLLSGALAVPQAAVLRGTPDFYVYVVKADHTVEKRTVVPGVVDGDWMAITGPVNPGEQVVVDGGDRVREGSTVEVIAGQ